MTIKFRSLLVGALSLFALPLAFAQDEQNGPAQPAGTTLQPAGQVVWVKGTVRATYPEQQPRVLARGAVVYEQDTIKTEGNSTGQIAFTDNSMVALNPNTTLAIEQYYFDQQKPTEGGQSVMNLVKGGLRAVTGFVAKAAPANYQMKTPVGTIGVRGTEYTTSCGNIPQQCAYGLLHGIIVLTNATGSYVLDGNNPYATVSSYTTKAVISHTAPGLLQSPPPAITPSNAPPQGAGGGGNCGILINS